LAGSTARRRRLGAISLTATTLLAGLPGSSLADRLDPAPTARDLANGKKRVRDQAAEIGRLDAQLAEADGRLRDLDDDAELAIERFNGARARQEQAERDYQTARTRADDARERLGQTRRELAVFASRAYRTDNSFPSLAAVLGGRGGPEGFLDRARFMQVLAGRQGFVVQREKAARGIADLFENQSRRALDAQRSATRAAANARQAATAAVDRQRASVKRIQQRKAVLAAALAKAKAQNARLRRARAAYLAAPKVVNDPKATARAVHALPHASGLGAIVARAALRWLGTPYSWGGGNASGPTLGIAQGAHTVGFDCSGLVTYAWARAGVPLTHYATAQYNSGPHPARNQLRPGDLVFFAHNPANPSTIHHVGIYIGNGQMVEAPFTGARVRISGAFRPDYAGATRPAGPR
jgi:cell wall-associated NlpC family hydrolase